MDKRDITQFESIDNNTLCVIEGGLVWWVPVGVIAYGVVAGYTDEKCIMDNGKHWYCTKLP